ncbi:copper-transporting ATPase [Cymbomonas tetramitiformis]|uniref:Copper-transporting ATPase n=1 Tax=Cymbomonas tetramitiformis TaxID=36881 RepID=A0AAE0FD28_9CHLO|nr:copper-transporting ATPase [Cymbomonas tetramitiformis]
MKMSTIAAAMPKLGWPMFFEEPMMLLAFVLLGRAVEERAKLRASSDMTELLGLLPTTARLCLPLQEDPAQSTDRAAPTCSEACSRPPAPLCGALIMLPTPVRCSLLWSRDDAPTPARSAICCGAVMKRPTPPCSLQLTL